MKIERVRDKNGLYRVNNSYIVNGNRKEYEAACKQKKKMRTLEDRLDAMYKILDKMQVKETGIANDNE
jgi:hypothetical protein